MYYFVSHHGELVIDPLRDAQPVKSDKRVSDVVRGCFQGELGLASFLFDLHVYIQVYIYTWKVHAFMCVYVCYYIIHNITAEK